MAITLENLGIAFRDIGVSLATAARHGCYLLRGVANSEGVYKRCYLRGPSGTIVMLAQNLQEC